MLPIARAIAIFLMLTFGFGVPVIAAQGLAAGDHAVVVALEDFQDSAKCVDCQSEHMAMSPTSCMTGCVGAAATGADAEARLEPFPPSFTVVRQFRLSHRSISPDPYPPRTLA